jgi:hypothetical protein
MTYLNSLTEEIGADVRDFRPIDRLLDENRVFSLFEGLGYRTVAVESGYLPTKIQEVDEYLQPRDEREQAFRSAYTLIGVTIKLTSFETNLLASTLLNPLFDYFLKPDPGVDTETLFSLHRERVLFGFESLPQIANRNGDYFVFAHILTPHPPFVFGEFGEELPMDHLYVLYDGADLVGKYITRSEYIDGYRSQLLYVNKLLQETIEKILMLSDSPPIIIIQGDHGPGAYLDWQSVANTNIRERMSIFNAYYFPDTDYELLSSQITPVNTFRIVFNRYFGADLELLPNRVYFSSTIRPYDFFDATEMLLAQ